MSDRTSEPNEVELQQTAQAAREALVTSIARLDDRVKHIRSTALNATAASVWGLGAACAWWLSFAIKPKPRADQSRVQRPSLFSTILTTTLRTAGVVVAGGLLYASYQRARRLADDQGAAVPVGRLEPGE